MSTVFHAILGNPCHPEYGVATVPFPIPAEEYDHIVEMMEALEIGSPTSADCRVFEIDGNFPVLKRLENLSVNLDELDYLAKRLDSFCDTEAAQFQAMAHKLETFTGKDFINLTLCCQDSTVITDFLDLESVGKDHYLALHRGVAPVAELRQIDGIETALLLIENGSGTVTPYGVVYDNGTKLEEVYDGQIFPNFEYGDTILTLTMSDQTDTMKETYLYLPMPESKVERVLHRADIQCLEDVRLHFAYSVEYKTNRKSGWKVLEDGLSSKTSYTLDCGREALDLASNEYVTEIRFNFGTVEPGFHEETGPSIYVTTKADLADGYRIINRTDVGGRIKDEWIVAKDTWITIVWGTERGDLPKTGI